MWFPGWRTAPHDGTAPAAALTTRFDFPCGRSFYDTACTTEPCFRSRCAPPAFDAYWWSAVGYYSPAICPSGYTVGCTRWDERQGPAVENGETAMQCVPSGFTCATDNPSFASAASSTARAPMIQIRWAESDLPQLETHPLTPDYYYGGPTVEAADLKYARQDISNSFGTPTSTGRPTGGNNGGGGSGSGSGGNGGSGNAGGSDIPDVGLSTGAKVGLGVAFGGVFLLLVGAFAVFAWWYRKRYVPQLRQRLAAERAAAATAAGASSQPGPGGGPSHPELGGKGKAVAAPSPTALASSHAPTASPAGSLPFSGPAPGVSPPPPAAMRPELNAVREPTSPAELNPEERMFEAGPTERPMPELAADPYHQQHQGSEGPWQGSAGTAAQYRSDTTRSASQQGVSSPPEPPYISNQDQAGPSQVSSQHQVPSQWSVGEPSSSALGQATSTPVIPPHHQQEQQTDGTEDMSLLMAAHSQLERRRQRLLELQQIEDEQEALRQRMDGRP